MTEQTNTQPGLDAPRFIKPEARVCTVTLDHPLSYGGYDYRAIIIKRLSAGEVATFLDSFRSDDETKAETAKARFPMFYREDGEPVPEVVLDALDDDDLVILDEKAASFLPRRFQSILNVGTSPESGEPTAP